jgi:hypothetical protein
MAGALVPKCTKSSPKINPLMIKVSIFMTHIPLRRIEEVKGY